MEKESSGENKAAFDCEVARSKLRGAFGQMETLLKWKDDPEGKYRMEYEKLVGNPAAKSKFDALHGELEALFGPGAKSGGVPAAQLQEWTGEWQEILNEIYKK